MIGQGVEWAIGLLLGVALGAGATYALLQARVKRSKVLFDISMQLNSTLKRREQMELIMNTAKQVLPVEAASVLLIDPETDELVFELAQGDKGEEVRSCG